MRYAAMEELKIDQLEQYTYSELEKMLNADKVIGAIPQEVRFNYKVSIPIKSIYTVSMEV